MNGFRILNLQRALSMTLLLAALFSQIQLLYACDSMEGKPKQVCCCGEHDSVICPMAADSSAMHENAQGTICCQVSYDTLSATGIINNTSTVDCLTFLLDGPQPPPITNLQHFSPNHFPALSRLSQTIDQPLIFSRGKQTYLLTRRLRL